MLIEFKKQHIKEISALFKKNRVQFSPFIRRIDNSYISTIMNGSNAAVTFLILSEKIKPIELTIQ